MFLTFTFIDFPNESQTEFTHLPTAQYPEILLLMMGSLALLMACSTVLRSCYELQVVISKSQAPLIYPKFIFNLSLYRIEASET